jgi:hypothetical protein
VKKVFGLVVILTVFVSCFPVFIPINTSFSATTSVESGNILGLKLYSTTSSIVLKPGEIRQILLSLSFKNTSSGRIEPNSIPSQYQIIWYSEPWLKVTILNKFINLNNSTEATLEVARDAPTGRYTIEFSALRTRGTLGEPSIRTNFGVEVIKPQ